VVLTLALGCWGRWVLRICKVDSSRGYGEPLTLAAGLAWFLVLSQILNPYLDNYRSFLKIFYLLGLSLSFIEIIIHLKISIKNKKTKISDLKTAIMKNEMFIVACVISIIVSILYASIWPSGTIELWMNNGADFYNWILYADYHLGIFNAQQFNVVPGFYLLSQDSIGTQLIIALLATINVESTFVSAPYSIITILIWFITAVYYILRKLFGFTLFYSSIITAGVLFGFLINYLVLFGQFGHLILIIMFLTTLSRLNLIDIKLMNSKYILSQISFPVISLFISYQSGYLLFCCLLSLFIFVQIYINLNRISLIERLSKSICLSTIPVIIATLAISLLMPGLALHVIERTGQVAEQTAGWPLPFLGPWLYSGLPFFTVSSLTDIAGQNATFFQKLVYYPLYILIILSMIYYIFTATREIRNSTSNTKSILFFSYNNNQNKYIISLAITYLTVLIFYFFLFVLYGNLYRVWKFAAYTALPLSFVPTALALLTLFHVSGGPKGLVAPLATLAVGLVCLVQFWFQPSLVQFPLKYYSIYSAIPFLNALYRTKDAIGKYKSIIIHVNEPSEYFFVSEVLSDFSDRKIEFINGLYYIVPQYDYFRLLNKDSVLISTYSFDSIYNGKLKGESYDKIYIYTFKDLIRLGYATLNSGEGEFKWSFINQLFVKVKIPQYLYNNNLKYSINVNVDDNSPEICKNMQFGFIDELNRLVMHARDAGDLSIEVPAGAIQDHTIKSVVLAPLETGCKYLVREVALDGSEQKAFN
jgi:hypothetical protein